MAKMLDPQVIATTMLGVIETTLAKMSGVTATDKSATKEIEIISYDGRMRVVGMEKFNAPSYISVVNYYLSPADMERHRAKGALVLFVDSENAGKMFKALGFPVSDDEDDASMMDACGELGNLIGGGFKNELLGLGYADLTMSAPHNYKNSVIEGVEYSKDQTIKVESSFFYWKRKAMVVEVTMADVPMRK